MALRDVIASMESDQFEESTKRDDVEIKPINTEDEVPEAGFIEGEEASIVAEQDQIREDGDKADNAMASLESLYSELSAAMDEGGMSPQTARVAALFGKQYARLSGEESPVASSEAFGGSSSRFCATRVSMEGVGEAIKKGWEAFVALLKKIGTFLAESTQRITFAAQRLEKSADRLLKVATTTKTSGAKVEIGGQPLLFVNGKFAENGGTELSVTAKLIWDIYPSAVTEYVKRARQAVARVKDASDVALLKSAINDGTMFARIGTKVSSAPFKTPENAEIYKSRNMPGDFAVYCIVSDGDLEGSTGLHFARDGKGSAPEKFETAGRAPSQIATQLRGVIAASRNIIGAGGHAKALRSSIDQIASDLSKLPAVQGDTGADPKMAAAARKIVNSMRSLIGKQYTGTRLHVIRCLSAQVKLAARELKVGDADHKTVSTVN